MVLARLHDDTDENNKVQTSPANNDLSLLIPAGFTLNGSGQLQGFALFSRLANLLQSYIRFCVLGTYAH